MYRHSGSLQCWSHRNQHGPKKAVINTTVEGGLVDDLR